MATYRIPVLVWQDFNGTFTAQAVTGEDYFPPAAFNAKRDAAIAEVKEYLQWLYESEWWRSDTAFDDLKLTEFRVDVRPEYKTKADEQSAKKKKRNPKEKTFAGDELIPMRVACLSWKTDAGNFAANLPLLDIEFFFDREAELKNLVNIKVQESLRGSTPLALVENLPPKEIELEIISFQARTKTKITTTYKETPSLLAVAEPLGSKDKAKKSQKPYEREAVVDDLVQRLSTERASVVLLGESGVGKTTILVDAVRKIERELLLSDFEDDDFDPEYDEHNPRNRFWQTNGGRLIAGMKYLGQWEERLESVIAELSDIDGVLCVESLLDLIRYGGRAPEESLAAFLVPYIQRGELRVVVEATPAELDACRRLLPGFAALFQIVRIPEFTIESALSVLTRIAETNVRNHGVEFPATVVSLVYRLFARFMPYRKFPGKTPAFLTALFETAAKARRESLSTDDVVGEFVKLTGLPELFLRDDVTLEFQDVVEALAADVIGQTAACESTAHIVTTFKAGLNDPRRPLGVFLFAGPTGVGKTELAKSLARFFFGGLSGEKERIVRLDMSEYNLSGAASRILTKPDGEPSELIQRVREQPFSVVLFDEVEKADAQVFDVLLGLFDEGRLTDRFGRVTDFTSAVVIMTSNLGAERFAKGDIGFGENDAISNEKEIKAFFRPEFFNRLDGVVQFKPLEKASLYSITEKEMKAVGEREGLKDRGVNLVWTKAVVEHIARLGFDPRFGARPLQRTIETELTAQLAAFLLENESARGKSIEVTVDEGRLRFGLL